MDGLCWRLFGRVFVSLVMPVRRLVGLEEGRETYVASTLLRRGEQGFARVDNGSASGRGSRRNFKREVGRM